MDVTEEIKKWDSDGSKRLAEELSQEKETPGLVITIKSPLAVLSTCVVATWFLTITSAAGTMLALYLTKK
jgi:hypothetical protein